MTTKQKRKPYYNIYKPLAKENAGAALQFSYDEFKQGLYLEAARQKGERLETGDKNQFDWENKIVFKIGVTDLGHLLLLMSGKTTKAKLIHKPVDGTHTSVLEIEKQDKQASGGYDNYACKLSRTVKEEGKENQTKSINIFIDHHEMVVLAQFFRESLNRMLGFNQ